MAKTAHHALVEWLDDTMRPVHAQQTTAAGAVFSVSLPADELVEHSRVVAVRAYAWSPSARRDAIGWAEVPRVTREAADDGETAPRSVQR